MVQLPLDFKANDPVLERGPGRKVGGAEEKAGREFSSSSRGVYTEFSERVHMAQVLALLSH